MYKEERNQNEIIAENITRLMREKGWSQNELGRKLDISAMAVNKWCRGITTPRNDQLDKLCQLFNVQRSDILTDRLAVPNLSIPAAYPVRMLGRICAGEGVIADESFDGYFFVDNSIRADYCLRVEGDSMTDAGINHGDIERLKEEHKKRVGDCEYLIRNAWGEAPSSNWCDKRMKELIENNNLPRVTIHGLRHTYASMLISDGVPIAEVSAQLGHSSVDVTLRIYTHLFTDASTASKAISDAINEKWAPKGHQ